MVPTTAEGTTLVLDDPIPEVDAELEVGFAPAEPAGEAATAHADRHAAFLAVVRGMVHGDPETSTVDSVADEDEQVVPEEDLGDWLPGLGTPEAPRRARARRSRDGSTRRLRRTARVVAVLALIGACALLPWAAPGVPRWFADLVPGGEKAAVVHDPPVAPPTDAFVGPVGVSQQAGPYDGVRLEAAGPPREVVVPRLHVDSRVLPISGQSGSLLPPSDPQLLGWWREGRPAGAEYGSAVVTGHTVHTGGGALDHLGKLVVGDVVRVRTDQGWIRYVVQRSRVYSKAELARDAKEIFRLGGAGRLVLITCDDWNGSFYESNAVVFAVPVDDQPDHPDLETEVPDAGPETDF